MFLLFLKDKLYVFLKQKKNQKHAFWINQIVCNIQYLFANASANKDKGSKGKVHGQGKARGQAYLAA
jgi:hypothetical protein